MTDRHWTPPVGLDQRTDDAAEEEPIRGAECNAACSIARQRPTPTPIGGMLPPADYASNDRTCERPYPGACPEVCPAAICDPHLGDVSRGNSHLGVGRLGETVLSRLSGNGARDTQLADRVRSRTHARRERVAPPRASLASVPGRRSSRK